MPPRRLLRWQYADYFEGQRERGLQRLLVSLKRRADGLGLIFEVPTPKIEEKPVEEKGPVFEQPKPSNKIILSNGMELMRVPAGEFLMGSTKDNKLAYDDERPQHIVDIPYDYWMARFPVTNELYNTYVKTKGIEHPVSGWGKKKDHPVVNMSWQDAMAYCRWLNDLFKNELPSGIALRLPTEAEWEKAARGTERREYPWGDEFDKNKCNTSEGGRGSTTSASLYSPHGDSPYSCADMAGNVWEWTHSEKKAYPYNAGDGREDEKASGTRVLRGGSFYYIERYARSAYRYDNDFDFFDRDFGFRVVASPA
jgi:formylglycine-generating enzyme required for sulfatase activity